jgi:hypothetical protein
LNVSPNYLSIKKLLTVQKDNGGSPKIIKTLPGVGSSSIVAAPSAHATPLVSNVHQVNLTRARQQKKHAKPRIHTPFRPDSSIAAKPGACQGHEQGRNQEGSDGPCPYAMIDTTSHQGASPSVDSISIASTQSQLSFDGSYSDLPKTNDLGMKNLMEKFVSCSLIVSVDGNEPHDASSTTFDLTTGQVQVDIEAPPGMLGLNVGQASPEWVKISYVSPDSVMYQKILEGDLISHVGNSVAMGKTYTEVAEEFTHTKLLPRFFRVWRLESLLNQHKCGGAVRQKGPVAGFPEEEGMIPQVKIKKEDAKSLLDESRASQKDDKASLQDTKPAAKVIGSLYTHDGLDALQVCPMARYCLQCRFYILII